MGKTNNSGAGNESGGQSKEGAPNDENQQPKSPQDSGGQFTPITSQEDLDRVVGQRLERKDRQVRAEYAGFDEYKAKAEELDQLKASQLTDQEKAVEATRAEAIEEITRKYQGQLVTASIREVATKLNFRDPGDAQAYLDATQFVDGDAISTDRITASLKELAESKPYLINATTSAEEPVKGQAPGSGTGDQRQSPNRGTGRQRAQEYLKQNKL